MPSTHRQVRHERAGAEGEGCTWVEGGLKESAATAAQLGCSVTCLMTSCVAALSTMWQFLTSLYLPWLQCHDTPAQLLVPWTEGDTEHASVVLHQFVLSVVNMQRHLARRSNFTGNSNAIIFFCNLCSYLLRFRLSLL